MDIVAIWYSQVSLCFPWMRLLSLLVWFLVGTFLSHLNKLVFIILQNHVTVPFFSFCHINFWTLVLPQRSYGAPFNQKHQICPIVLKACSFGVLPSQGKPSTGLIYMAADLHLIVVIPVYLYINPMSTVTILYPESPEEIKNRQNMLRLDYRLVILNTIFCSSAPEEAPCQLWNELSSVPFC